MNKYEIDFIDNIINDAKELNPNLHKDRIKYFYLKNKDKSWYIIKGLMYGVDLTNYLKLDIKYNQQQINFLINNLLKKYNKKTNPVRF